MTGHLPILAMRRAGRRPAFVWVSDHQHQVLDGLTVRVTGDTPELLDLRFLVGVTVLVEGPDQARVDRIASACTPIAARVIGTTAPVRDVTRITDSMEVIQWPN